MFDQDLLNQIRHKFHHVDNCPYQGQRAYFENAGGSLTLKTVVDVNSRLSAIPDNQGRANPASYELVKIISQGRVDMMTFLGAKNGEVFVGESGTELLFRLIRAAVLGSESGGDVIGSSLEHPATVSAARRWASISGKNYISIPHDKSTATVTSVDYQQHVTPVTRVATIIHTSPVSGMEVELVDIVESIRDVSPDCFIIVDGIQHAAHGCVDVNSCDIDGYTLSAYKIFSKHNYGVAWISPKMSTLPHDRLDGTAENFWELGTRDTSAFATFSEVVNYLDWLGSNFTKSTDRREKLIMAAKAISAEESYLVSIMMNGIDGLLGLSEMPDIYVIGGSETRDRAGVVSFSVKGINSADVVDQLGNDGVRTHIRKNDYFSGNILKPLGLDSCIRASVCHYNSTDEVKRFLQSIAAMTA